MAEHEPMTGPAVRSWAALPEFRGTLDATDQIVVVAATGGAKSTLVATLTLDVPSLVALDEKAALTLPRARIVQLPPYDRDNPDGYDAFLARALAWQDPGNGGTNRVILRPDIMDLDSFDAHDRIFRAIYLRSQRGAPALVWIDEVTATGATAQRVQPWLRGLSARGRTLGIGIITCSQAPFGLLPTILRRNARLLIIGPIDPQDIADLRRPDIELATTIPPRTGRFIVYVSGERGAYRLHLPIPPILKGWRAP